MSQYILITLIQRTCTDRGGGTADWGRSGADWGGGRAGRTTNAT